MEQSDISIFVKSWSVNTAVRYYSKRAVFFETMEKLFNLFTIIGGTSIITSIKSDWPNGTLIAIGIFISLIGAIPLVFNFTELRINAIKFMQLYRSVQADIEQQEPMRYPDEPTSTQILNKLKEIQIQEPPTLSILCFICEQEANNYLGLKDNAIDIPLHFRLTAHFGDFFDLTKHCGKST